MAYTGPFRRWDIFWADLEPHVGSEQAGESRPVLVVSNDEFNKRFPAVTVVPLTKMEGKTRPLFAGEVLLPKESIGNDHTPLAQPFHVRTISPLRLLSFAGRLEDELVQERIELSLIAHLGIELDEE